MPYSLRVRTELTNQPYTWTEVSSILDAMLDTPLVERSAALQELCGENESLKAEVLSLLESCESDEDFLTGGEKVGALATALIDAEEGPDRGGEQKRLGAYLLQSVIGRGGMGVVYLAQRADGEFDQTVAIKVLPPALQTADFERRFRAERQILADLAHPNIAQLLDGGVAEDATPFFVMEFIQGTPIDQYCRENQLGLRARLELFLKVCSAVAFAHQNLVVHRDLKPGNILVDDAGAPKLLDFGIAKLIGDADAPAAETVFAALTPTHAAPEQFSSSTVTTQTDVYALGVLLYQLLTDDLPVSYAGLTPAQSAKHALEHIPEPPSRRPSSISHIERRRLAGDLDAITFQALRKRPTNRYGSVQALADDVQRHLSAQPVTARPASWLYSSGKFLSRHRVGVAIGSLVLLAALTGIAGIVWQSEQTRQEAAKSAQIASFLSSVFDGANPFSQWEEEPTLREILSTSVTRTQAELADQPEVQAEMLRLLGVATTGLGDYEQATTLLRRALELRQEFEPGKLAGHIAVRRDLGTALIEQGLFDQAIEVSRKALDEVASLPATDPVLQADALTNLAVALSRSGSEEDAEGYYREALKLRESSLAPLDYRTGNALASLGALLSRSGKMEEGVVFSRRALETYQHALGENNPLTLRAKNDLASTLFLQGDAGAASTLFAQLLESSQNRLGSDHPELVLPLNNLGRVLSEQCRFDEALAHLEQALMIAQNSIAEGQPLRLATQFNLGSVLFELGEFERSAKLVGQAYAGYLQLLGDQHPVIQRTRIRQAEIAWFSGQIEETETLLEPFRLDMHAPPLDDNAALAHLLLARVSLVRNDYTAAQTYMNGIETAWQGASEMVTMRAAEAAIVQAYVEKQSPPSFALETLTELLPPQSPRLKALQSPP